MPARQFSNQQRRPRQQQLLFISSIGASILLAATILLSSSAVQLVRASDSNLLKELTNQKISPLIIDASYANQVEVYLHGAKLKPGVQVAARQFKEIDILKTSWAASNNDAQHTLIMLDLDRKLRASNQSQPESPYNLFTTVNIPGHSIAQGQAIVSMEAPTVPCLPTQKHRILMLVFHQSQTIDLSDVINIAASPGQSGKRENFNLNTFINRHRLNLVAANVFMAVGEMGGVCSGAGASLLNSFQSLSSIVIEMVIVGTAVVTLMTRRQTIIGRDN